MIFLGFVTQVTPVCPVQVTLYGAISYLLCRLSNVKDRQHSLWRVSLFAALSLPFCWVSGGPTHLTKQSGSSERERDREREREREREKSILVSTTVEHAPIWRPGRLGGSWHHAFGPCWVEVESGLQNEGLKSLAVCPQVQSSPVAVPPRTLTATSTLPSRPAPMRPSSSAPACSTTRA